MSFDVIHKFNNIYVIQSLNDENAGEHLHEDIKVFENIHAGFKVSKPNSILQNQKQISTPCWN